jgi:hypothetical protein
MSLGGLEHARSCVLPKDRAYVGGGVLARLLLDVIGFARAYGRREANAAIPWVLGLYAGRHDFRLEGGDLQDLRASFHAWRP